MNFVYISPHFPKTGSQFCDRLNKNGIRVLGIADCNYENLDPVLRNSLTDYYKVNSLENYDEMYRAIAFFSFKYGKIDWLESNNEHWLEQDARLRDDFNIKSGWSYEEMHRLKFKSQMKAFYERANVPVARYHLVTTLAAGQEFIMEVGYPVVVKPDNGVGAAATYKLKDDKDLEKFYDDLPQTTYIMEEYISGIIQTYDGIFDAQSNPLFETSFVCTPVMDVVNDGAELEYHIVREIDPKLLEAGRRTVKSFGVKSRFIHFEFFKLDKAKKGLGEVGDYVALEANMRPAGGYTPDMYNFANSLDVYKIYADMIAYNKADIDPERETFFCSYTGRFNSKNYKHTHEQIFEKFQGKLVMYERMPEVLAGAMGNHMYAAKLKTKEELAEFKKFVLKLVD